MNGFAVICLRIHLRLYIIAFVINDGGVTGRFYVIELLLLKSDITYIYNLIIFENTI